MKIYIYITILTIILFISSTLFAQEKSITDSIHSLSEVVVQGQTKTVEVGKLSVPLQFLPVTVSSVSAKTLESTPINT